MSLTLIAGRSPAALLALALVALAAPSVLAEEAPAPLVESVQRRVDVNVAGEPELLVLPQVGPVVARRIVEYRKAVGPFRKVEELLNVKGIGRKTLDRLRPLITLGSPALDDASARAKGSGS
jgi:competence protein ComEA